jgi:hypothetical protein
VGANHAFVPGSLGVEQLEGGGAPAKRGYLVFGLDCGLDFVLVGVHYQDFVVHFAAAHHQDA